MQLARKTQKIQCIYDFFLIKSRHNSKIFSVMRTIYWIFIVSLRKTSVPKFHSRTINHRDQIYFENKSFGEELFCELPTVA